ncbi:MAG: bifunctional riboflavin kinase/FAD synthetase [Oscillospiraceae bacterium]|nr:bifunctional riboflavin kinase/FAD synthetase [Oscillospiraceae bacterium]
MIFVTNETIKEKTAVALGIFDGVHLGHRLILDTAKTFSEKGMKFAVFTFKTASVEIKHGKPYEYLYTENQKNHILENLGAEYICSPDISAIKNMSGEQFAKEILAEKMNAGAVVCGENFRFGKDASCGAEDIVAFGKKYGFEVIVCKTLEKNGEKISSGKIKDYLKNGELSKANELLGERYFILGEVVTGNRLGRTISFPTINQLFEEKQVVPKKGAYASSTEIYEKEYCAITNIGVKPTVESNIKPLAETHIIDFGSDIYGKTIKTEFIEFLREEKKFPSLEHLKEQILSDLNTAKKFYLSK